jgi:hypothetical protein
MQKSAHYWYSIVTFWGELLWGIFGKKGSASTRLFLLRSTNTSNWDIDAEWRSGRKTVYPKVTSYRKELFALVICMPELKVKLFFSYVNQQASEFISIDVNNYTMHIQTPLL